MVLNAVLSPEEDLIGVIDQNLGNLCSALAKEGITVKPEDFRYTFFSRVELLAIPSSKIYPGEDLPKMFGVQRGYNGGGIHRELMQTETDRMTTSRRAKAERLLKLIRNTFWQVLKDMDGKDEENTNETKQPWEKLTL